MLGSAPYILVIGHVLTVVVIELVWKLLGGIQKHQALIPGSSSRFALNLVLIILRPEGTRE